MDIPSQLIAQAGPLGALTLVVVTVGLAFVRGRIVPRSAIDDVRADRDERVKAAEHREEQWRAAYLASAATNAELVRQNDELLELSRTGAAMMRALPAALPAAVDRVQRP